MRYYQNSFIPGYFGIHLTKTVKILIIINIIIFLLVHFFPIWLTFLGMVPEAVISKFRLWQLVTYMFVHIGLWHLVINMLMLAFFAPSIEAIWGRKQFLLYYFFTGIGAAICSLLTSIGSSIPVVGASGAIFGILVAYAMLFPDTILLLFFFFPMKIKQAVVVLAIINLLGALTSAHSGIAYVAHLGGGLFGYIYLKSERLRIQLLRWSSFNVVFWIKHYLKEREGRKRKKIDEEVDRILDKVAQKGMKSLTRRERKILYYKSKNV